MPEQRRIGVQRLWPMVATVLSPWRWPPGLLIGATLDNRAARSHGGSRTVAYLACFVALFGLAELGDWSRAISGIVIGFVAVCGALGGVGINFVLREPYLSRS